MATTNPAGVLKRNNAYFIDPKRIVRKVGFNPRFDFGDIRELANSIKQVLEQDPGSGGLLNDIRVKRIKGSETADFELVDGDRRLTAIELLMSEGVEFPQGVPAKIEAHDADIMDLLVHAFVANDGKRFLPLEEAAGYKRMRDHGWTLETIAQRVGRSVLHIGTTLELLNADQSVQDAVKNGDLSASAGKSIATAAKGDKGKQKELVEKAVAAKGDKGKKAEVDREIEAARADRNAKKGKVLKVRPLSADELHQLGLKMQAQLEGTLKDSQAQDAALTDDKVLMERIASNDILAAAFSLGALMALKAAAGVKTSLTV